MPENRPVPGSREHVVKRISAISKRLIGAMSIVCGVLMTTPVTAAPGWTTASTIGEIISAEDGIVIIVSNGGNPMNCATPTWYRLRPSVANYEATVALVMSAKAQDKLMQFWASSCATDGASLIVAAWLKN